MKGRPARGRLFSVVGRPLLPLLWLLLAVPLSAADLRVQRVVDGDTILLSSGERVRLIGVDTPESHPSPKLTRDAKGSKKRAAAIRELGGRAKRFVQALVEGRPVRLENDPANAAAGHRDRYGRRLAYVYFTPADCEELEAWVADDVCEAETYDEGFLNGLIVEAGYGSVYTRAPFVHSQRFLELERDAREEERGLWRPDPLEATYPRGSLLTARR